MNLGGQSSPVNSAGARGNGPELDEVLQNFFQSELPHPWPAFVEPAPTVRLPLRRWFTSNRLALAASIALLLLGSLAFPTAFQPRGAGPNVVGPESTISTGDSWRRGLGTPAPSREKPTVNNHKN
jgi:hypothetical protein